MRTISEDLRDVHAEQARVITNDVPVSPLNTVKMENFEETLFSKTVMIYVEAHKMGNERQTKAEVKTNAEQNLLKVKKIILDCPEMRLVQKIDTRIKNQLKGYCLPNNVFPDGIYIVPLNSLDKAYALLENGKLEREQAVNALIDVYDERKKEHQTRLGDLFEDNNYPKKSTLKDVFGFRFRIISMNLPQNLREIQKSIFDQERIKIREEAKKTRDNTIQALRIGFRELVSHMLEKLSDGQNGEKKQFKQATRNNIFKYVQEFQNKNIFEDNELETEITKAKEILSCCSLSELKNNDEVRDVVKTKLFEIQKQLDENMITTNRTFRYITE